MVGTLNNLCYDNFMITGRQIRAARSLLEWKAEDLAEKAGLTRVTVSKIESNDVQPHEKTIAAIMRAFDQNGIEFLDDEGVRVRKHQIRVFSGKEGYIQFLDHIYDTMKDGGIIRQFNLSDGNNLAYADEYKTAHLERMSKIQNLDARILTVEGDYNFPAKYCVYRWLRRENKILIPYYLYNDYIAQSVSKTTNHIEVISLRSTLLAEKYTRQFGLFWDDALLPDSPKKKQKAQP